MNPCKENCSEGNGLVGRWLKNTRPYKAANYVIAKGPHPLNLDLSLGGRGRWPPRKSNPEKKPHVLLSCCTFNLKRTTPLFFLLDPMRGSRAGRVSEMTHQMLTSDAPQIPDRVLQKQLHISSDNTRGIPSRSAVNSSWCFFISRSARVSPFVSASSCSQRGGKRQYPAFAACGGHVRHETLSLGTAQHCVQFSRSFDQRGEDVGWSPLLLCAAGSGDERKKASSKKGKECNKEIGPAGQKRRERGS
jgi:hypothetical protein